MLAIGYSAALRVVDSYVVRVEVVRVPTTDISIHIVGLARRSIQESNERVNAAVRSCSYLLQGRQVALATKALFVEVKVAELQRDKLGRQRIVAMGEPR